MRSAAEPGRFRPRRRPALELGMTPLIDIVFLLLIFFMLTSRFVVQEGIKVDLPETDRSHTLPAKVTHRITVDPGDVLKLNGLAMSLEDLSRYIGGQEAGFMSTPFEILADRQVSMQAVISLLEMLRNNGAAQVTLGTEQAASGEYPVTGR